MNRTSLVALAALGLALGGCATPSQRIAVVLTEQGLDPGLARCIGDRMEARLSIGQLLQLNRAAKAYRRSRGGRPMTFTGLLTAARDVRDPQIAIEAISAGISCGLRG